MFLSPRAAHPLILIFVATALTSCLSEEIVAVSDTGHESVSFADQKKALRGENSVILDLKKKKEFTGEIGFSPSSSEAGYDNNGPNSVPAIYIKVHDPPLLVPPTFSVKDSDSDKQSKQLRVGEGKLEYSDRVCLCRDNPCHWDNPWRFACVAVGSHKGMPIAVPENTCSYIWIPQGLFIIYWEIYNFNGWSDCIAAKTMSLNVNMGGHDDAMSSYYIGYAKDVVNCRIY